MKGGLSICLALLRIATGVSLIGTGLKKVSWFAHPMLEQQLAGFASHAPNGLVTSYLHAVTPHHAVLARVVVLGELGLGTLLILGLFTPLAAALAFLMVAQFHFASGAMFQAMYFVGQNGLVFLLVFPVLLTGRAGVALGLDGFLGRSMTRAPARA
jgi:putative oxidoreductase